MKRFLTQALVDHMSAAKARIRHHGDWHRCVWQAFNPIEGDRGPRRWLYAVDETPQGYKTLILSDEVPTRPDWCPAMGWTTKSIPLGFLDHSRYAFGLTANTTSCNDGTRTNLAKRASVDDDPEPRLLDWLERKGNQGGFRIYKAKTLVLPMAVESFPTSDGSQKITFQYVRFQGVLEVTDLEKFQNSFNTGIGRGKSFGAGLLLLKPIN